MPYSDHSDKKRTCKFESEIQVIIDNDPSQSIRPIAKEMGVSDFFIRQYQKGNSQNNCSLALFPLNV